MIIAGGSDELSCNGSVKTPPRDIHSRYHVGMAESGLGCSGTS